MNIATQSNKQQHRWVQPFHNADHRQNLLKLKRKATPVNRYQESTSKRNREAFDRTFSNNGKKRQSNLKRDLLRIFTNRHDDRFQPRSIIRCSVKCVCKLAAFHQHSSATKTATPEILKNYSSELRLNGKQKQRSQLTIAISVST